MVVRTVVSVALAVVVAGAAGCATLSVPKLTDVSAPSNDRNWKPNQATLARADFHGDKVRVHNVRNCIYFGPDDYVLNYYDATYDLSDVQSVDFIVVPFQDVPMLAHTMLSFGFADGRHLAVSVEVRLEEGESYSPVLGAMRQFEIIYVVGDERDLIQLRTNQRHDDVYVYRTKATPAQAHDILVDVLRRVNKLAIEPEFYDTLTNNCTTNIVRHINQLDPGRIPYDVRILLPGYSDELAYDLGLLESHGSFEETRRLARVTDRAIKAAGRPDFSQLIRR